MPVRRPSASTGLGSATTSSTRVHKSNDSHPTFVGASTTQSHSINSIGATATPQQKIVQVLVNRLKNKLPCNSGITLDRLEEDVATQRACEALVDLSHDSMDIIAWALSELLDRLAKQTDSQGLHTIEVLQSQLFVLKVLTIAMASRWNQPSRSDSQASNRRSGSAPNSPAPSSTTNKRSKQSSEYSSSLPPWADPPPLDDNCARYILSVMVLFLRQTALPETPLMPLNASTDLSFRDFEPLDQIASAHVLEVYRNPPTQTSSASITTQDQHPPSLRNRPSNNSMKSARSANSTIPIPRNDMTYDKTHMTLVNSSLSLNALIAKYSGKIIYHLSASNWKVVFDRLRTKIYFLASNPEGRPDTVDLQLMAHSALDRPRLIQVLNELSSLLVEMKPEDHVAIAVPLRTAIWNWINLFPTEFNHVIRTKGRMDSAPERVFDLLYIKNLPGNERFVWPTLAVLNCITSDRLDADLQSVQFGGGGSSQKHARKDIRFCENVVKNANSISRLSEIAFVCALDICRAASYVRPEEGEVNLLLLAHDIAHEIKMSLWMNPSRKPFWELTDDIDVAMYAEALTTVFRLLPEEDSIPLFTVCLEPERSEAIKTCALRSFLTLITEASRMPWQKGLENLAIIAAPRLRGIFKTASLRRTEADQKGNVKRISPRPKGRRGNLRQLCDRDVMLLAILSVWRGNPAFFMMNLTIKDVDEWVHSAVKMWEAPIDISIKTSTASSFRLMAEITFKMSPTDPFFDVVVAWTTRCLWTTLVSVCTHLIHARTDAEAQRLWMMTAHHLLELYIRPSDVPHVKGIQLSPVRLAAFALAEIAFLVSLTSEDSTVSSLAGKGLRLLVIAERQPDAPFNPNVNDEDRSKRNPVYEQLGDPNIVFVGRVGHQKRIRKLVRLIAYPSPTHVAVWQECYWRWRSLSEVIFLTIREGSEESQKERQQVPQEKRFQWQNLTLFLAAFGGACVQEEQDTESLTSIIPPQFLPDEMRVPKSPSALIGIFVANLSDLLVTEDVQLRDAAKDALGTELSPRLYSRLLKHLDEVTRNITQGAGIDMTEDFALFLDQSIAVLKLLVDNALPVEEVLSIDISSTVLALASFLGRFNEPTSFRIKIKFCALCDRICERTDTLTIRKDSPTRHSILDIIMEWMHQSTGASEDPLSPVQNELNLACLRTAVKLLDRLQLRPLEGSSAADDAAHIVSRLFMRYSSALLKGLETYHSEMPTSDSVSDVGSVQKKMRASQREAELLELVITGLSHLVSANTESGFKQCLPLAYDQDIRKRTIFAHVFARVLGQGTKFEAEDRSEAHARQNRLCELVRGSDMVLAMAICEICPPSEVEIIVSVLLNVFDDRAHLMALLKLMIDREIAHTDNEAALFRGNSTCTRFLSAFAKTHGYNYLRNLIIPLIKCMTDLPPGSGFELDPAKAGDQDVAENQKNVETVTASFLNIISSSISSLPPMFREICAHIANAVVEVWPKAKFAALGAFIFLRFISPAVVAPEIVDVELPKGDTILLRRGLMIVAKIIQNLANNIFFGKEAHMVVLNKFLEDNITNVTRYLNDLKKYSEVYMDDEDDDEWLGTTSDDTDVIVLHRFFEKHADKIGKELLSLSSKPSVDGDNSPVSGKNAWDGLCTLLVDLGSSLEVPRISTATSQEHRDYNDLLNRCAHRNTDSVRHIFVETNVPEDQPAIFILRTTQIDVEALDIELLMFHIFKTLGQPSYEDRLFEIILDCTSFVSLAEAPLQWLKYCAELIPSDIHARLLSTHVLNPNILFQQYMRRLYNVSAGSPFCGEIKTYSSISQLRERIPESALESLEYPMSLEREQSRDFEINMRELHQTHLPVVFRIYTTHIRITSIKAQSISPSFSSKFTEIVPLADVSDAYSVSTGKDPNEFIIRRSRQGATMYFSSPSRDDIVKHIRTTKSQLKDMQTPLTERFSRFSNVPATLLHVGMLNVDHEDEELRGAAYGLLGAVCSYIKYDKSPIVASTAGFIPGDPGAFVVQLSEHLADFAPALTLDFISEVSAGMPQMDKSAIAQRINCLYYMSPWMKNLARFPNPTSPLFERSGTRLRDCIRVLTDLTVAEPELASIIQRYIWGEIAKLDSTAVNIALDELVRAATDGGIGSRRCEVIARVVAALSSINVRGKLFAKLRKALGKSMPKSSRTAADNANWNEISALIRLIHVAGNQSKQPTHNQLYVPELVHLVSLLSGTGITLVRKSVYGIVMNLLQSMYLARAEDGDAELLEVIAECTQPETLLLFGLTRPTTTSEYSNIDPLNDKVLLETQEALAKLLVRILEVTAGTKGLLNVWRARWMSLVTATAFQLSPAIQTRAFVALGTLATTEVEDDFLYQMLVAFKTGLAHSTETETTSVVSMLRCIAKVVPALPNPSRYLLSLFWLAVALLQSSQVAFYEEAAHLLTATLECMDSRGLFKQNSVSLVLLDGRAHLEEVAGQLDQMLGLSFDSSFSFTLASILFKGVRHSGLKESADIALRTLLRVTVKSFDAETESVNGFRDTISPEALGYFIALLPLSTTSCAYRRLLQDCNIDESWFPERSGTMSDDTSVPRVSLGLIGLHDPTNALLVASFLAAILVSAQGDDAETTILYNLLSDVATLFPDTVAMTYDVLQDRIKDTFANSSNPSIIKAVSNIFQVSWQETHRFGPMRGSSSTLSTVDESIHGPGKIHLSALEEAGMHGLANNFQFLPPNRGHGTTMLHWIPEILDIVLQT